VAIKKIFNLKKKKKNRNPQEESVLALQRRKL